jgi:acetoacetate decarboxylase
MPALFGPSPVPDCTLVSDARALVLSFKTSTTAAQSLVPKHFRVLHEPTVSVAHVNYRNVDYLGGRSYNELVVTVSATYGDGHSQIDGAFAPVLWVNQVGALIAGREFMGLPKLAGVIPDPEESTTGLVFRCFEYDALLVECEVNSLIPINEDRLSKINERAGEVRTFGWKYIPAAGGGCDADYPLVNVMRWTYERAWTGQGSIRFLVPTKIEAPFSAQVLAVLATIPVIGAIRAFRGVGQALIDRTATRRLSDHCQPRRPYT